MTDANNNQEPSTFLSHLIELRDILLKIVISVGIVFLLLIPFAQDLYSWLSEPLRAAMPDGHKMQAISVVSMLLSPSRQWHS